MKDNKTKGYKPDVIDPRVNTTQLDIQYTNNTTQFVKSELLGKMSKCIRFIWDKNGKVITLVES